MQKGRDDRTVRLQGLVHLVISENSCCMKEEIPTLSSRQRSKIILQNSAAYYAFYFLEFADFYTREANDEREMLKLLYQTMRVLTKKIIPFELVRYIFELKALSVSGEGPQVFQCVRCGNRERPCVFSVKEGGLVCSECGQNVYDGMRLNTSTLYAMQFIVGTPVEKLYTFTLSDEVLKELGKLMGRYLDVYVAHRFKSLEILEQLTGLK